MRENGRCAHSMHSFFVSDTSAPEDVAGTDTPTRVASTENLQTLGSSVNLAESPKREASMGKRRHSTSAAELTDVELSRMFGGARRASLRTWDCECERVSVAVNVLVCV